MLDHRTSAKQRKWILLLLYAPQSEGRERVIRGKTRLVKGIFLVEQMFSEKFPEFEGTGFAFEAYKYGPFDEGIYHTLETLESESLVHIRPTGDDKGDIIRLTEEGEKTAEGYWQQLPPEQKKHLSWIKGKHVNQPVAQLLSFVYNRYPDMARNSKHRLS